MKRWVGYLGSRAEGEILAYSYYGDWSPPTAESHSGSQGDSAVSKYTPGALISTGFYFYSARLLAQIAGVLGYREDEAAFSALSEKIGAAYHRQFWDEAQGGYGSNNQACNAFSLYMGLVPEACQARVLENLAWDVLELHGGHLTTGNLCTKYLLEALTDGGRGDAAFAIATQETYPGWGYMLANGATTLWERWEHRTSGGMNSHNHPMMGSVGSWFYKGLAGIRPDPQGPGFARFQIRPYPPKGLSSARAALQTIRGRVEVAWEWLPEGFGLRATVPVGCRARVSVPKPAGADPAGFEIVEGGQPVWAAGSRLAAAGILDAQEEDSYVTFTVGSGSYSFLCRPGDGV
jgi:alpha-L-rhamnosidase